MTLIVGIICKDGTILAADSQTTRAMAKLSGTKKISVVEFANGKALVAESGAADLSNKAIEIFQKKAAGILIENEDTVPKLAEQSIRELRSGLTSLHPNNNSPTEWQDFFLSDTNRFELVVAYYCEDKPYLYKLNPAWCIPVKATSYFLTSGIASDLANYILKEHTSPQMESEFASVIAIKVVEDAIEYIEGCGGPPRVALIRPPLPNLREQLLRPPAEPTAAWKLEGMFGSVTYQEPVVIFPSEKVEEIAKIIVSVERQTKSTQNKKIHGALRAQTDKLLKNLYAVPLSRETRKKLKELEKRHGK